MIARLDRDGWELHLHYDVHGNLFQKTWVHPNDRTLTRVRRYTYSSLPEHKLICETDIRGRAKVFQYGAQRQELASEKQDGFIEELEQYPHMPVPSPARKPEAAFRGLFSYDESGRTSGGRR